MEKFEDVRYIYAGKKGEKGCHTVKCDVSGVLEQFPSATIQVLVHRNGDDDPYIATTSVTDGILSFPITDVETSVAGDHEMEIRAVYGNTLLCKSHIIILRVDYAMDGDASSTPPSALTTWVDALTLAIGYAQKFQTVTATAESGTTAAVTLTQTASSSAFAFTLPKGDTGATGNGIASVAKTGTSGLVDTYTITFTNGTTTTFTVTNGEDGGNTDPNAVHYTAETKTDSEKTQARTNIGAAGTGDLVTSVSASSTDSQFPSAKCVYTLVGNVESALAALL